MLLPNGPSREICQAYCCINIQVIQIGILKFFG